MSDDEGRRVQVELRCPTCGYDLRGSHVERDPFQCPECGAVTDATAIAEHDRRRRRSARRMRIGGGFAGLFLVALVVLVPMIRARANLAQVAVVFAMGVLLFWIMTLWWMEAPQLLRLLGAATSALVMVTLGMSVPGQAGAWAAGIGSTAVFLAFTGWAMHRGAY